MKLKDGTMMPVVQVTKKHANETTMMGEIRELKDMVQKHVNAAIKDEEEEDGDDDLLFVGGGKPRCEQKKRAFMSLGIKDRLGKKSKTAEGDSEDSE